MRRVTIKDIARIAGVSYATVSRALSGSPEISEETRVRVLAICKSEGYRVNSLARSLISNKTNVLGLIIPDITNPFYSELSLDIEICARNMGYNVMLCNSLHEGARAEELFEFLIGHQVDGIIMASSQSEAHNWVAHYFPTVPTVLLGDSTSDADDPEAQAINSVSVDNRMGGWTGVKYLYELGHRDILYLGMREKSVTHQRRARGYLSAMQHYGLTPSVLKNPWDFSSIEHGYALAKPLFAEGFHGSAIFATTDATALGVLQAADECGIDIPGDISLLGFDNITFSALPKITLSTIDQRKQQLAEAAVSLLLSLIENPDSGECTRRLIHPVLVERRSCKKIEA